MDSRKPEPTKITNLDRRLRLIEKRRSLFSRKLTTDVYRDSLANKRKAEGSGETSPATLDHSCISALKPTDCRRPMWVKLECVHGNRTGKAIRCRKCEGCRHAWRKKVRYLIGDGCKGHGAWFLTLTLREYPEEMDMDRFDFAQVRWHQLLRLADKEGLSFQFIRVVELQKRGTPHFHLAVNRIKIGGKSIVSTQDVVVLFTRLALAAGFGEQLRVERARLGAKGVASYLSKYLTKSEVFEMARPDGRAIRRYSRSQSWCFMDKKDRVWRYRKVGDIYHDEVLESTLPCVCGRGLILLQLQQARRWLERCKGFNAWVAPLDVFDWVHSENGITGGS